MIVAILTGLGGPMLPGSGRAQDPAGLSVAILTGLGGPMLHGAVTGHRRPGRQLRSSRASEGPCCSRREAGDEDRDAVAILTGLGGPMLRRLTSTNHQNTTQER
jgi:hypothetical protein